MSHGAKPTESVAQLFRTTGTTERFARLRKGEALETLIAEGKAAEVKRAAPLNTNKK
jgi:ribosomal protein S16